MSSRCPLLFPLALARRLLTVLLLAACLPVWLRPAQAQAPLSRPLLYVYLPSEVKSSVLERTLRQQLPSLEVTVFGRFRDFEEAMGRRPPDAVVAIPPLLKSLAIAPTLQGLRGDRDWEPYLLLFDAAAGDSGATPSVVGVVDLLGRTGTQQLASKLLGNPAVELRRVTKLEDLLPLLQLSAAQAVLVPADAARGFAERSRLKLVVRSLPEARVGLPAVGVLNAQTAARVVAQIQTLDPDACRMLGIERWRAR
jgi:hypothetical protein